MKTRYVISAAALCLLLMGLVSTVKAADEVKSPGEATISVEPSKADLVGDLARLQLVTTQAVSSDRRLDVTRRAKYQSLTPEVVSVDATGFVKPIAGGEGRIRVTQGGQAVEVSVQVSGIASQPTASFRHDVVPILSRAGCSGGSCHASQYGKAGFKISLWGFAPEQDYEPLARDRMRRRISLVRPEDSLILKKATQQISHGGGKRFTARSYDYEVLLTWLKAGAPGLAKDSPEAVGLEVFPRHRVYTPGDEQQLRVTVRYSDGSHRDVTRTARYDSMSDAIATITPTGYVTAVGSGQSPIMVRYMGQAKTSMAIVPNDHQYDLTGFTPHNFIDEFVLRRWRLLGLEASPLCDDQTFVRRAYLDAIGTVPQAERIEAFVESKDPAKREKLVDELLGLTGDSRRDVYVREYSAYWALKWGDLLRNNRNKLGDGGMWSLYNWTRASLRENKPIDQFVRELITAQGSVFENGPANYYKITTKAEDLAETTAQIFLGVRLQCAKCHHHPFESYSQADYYGLAAFFTRVGTKASSDFGALGGDTVVLVKRSGSIRHPRSRKTMQPKPLAGEAIDPSAHRDLRRPLAAWLTAPENRLFSRNMVNRFWGYFMGTGLVEPIDDMRSTNPASNPELLDALADDFVKHKYDLRQLMRTIMTSRVYQLSSHPTTSNAADTRFYTHYNVKRLPAEVLLDAIDFAAGVREKFSGIPAGTRAIELPDSNYASYFLDTMGRPKRVIACECERTAAPNLAQVLHIANGDVVQRKVSDKKGRVAKLLAAKKSDEAIFSELYMSTLCRPPSDEEVASCSRIVAAAENRKEGIEDILWALCNGREFLFNH